MEWIRQIWDQISTLFKWWVIIMPWEAGLRIRFGKKIKTLDAGIHFRIPYIDTCYRQSTRIAFINISPQTLTTKTGETVTISLIIGYSISDILKVHTSVSEIQGALTGKVAGCVSDFISTTEIDKCKPKDVELHAIQTLSEEDWGIDIEEIKVTSYAIVKTYRLIQDPNWMSTSHTLDTKI
jgi:regulator of protease activity HflC (stomatin/prohibitin superfamily)